MVQKKAPTPKGQTPQTAVKQFLGKVHHAAAFEACFRRCLLEANGSVEFVLLRAYKQLRREEEEATRILADHIESGFREWYRLMQAAARKATAEES